MNDAAAASAPALDPAEAFRRASALHREGRLAEADALLREALVAHANDGVLWNARGVVLAAMGRVVEAVGCYREALGRNPDGAGTWTNLGNALTRLKQLKSAIACHRRAIALSGRDALLQHNLGITLSSAGCHGEAIGAFTRALEIDPDYRMARWDRARSYLFLGNYRRGWADYEIRLATGQLPKREAPGAKWDGAPYGGRRLVLMAEQGFGDMLWVARYLPRVKGLGGELVIECRRELIPLIEAMGTADRVIERDQTLPQAELHGYICSLPGLFTPDAASIPSPPYLAAPADRVAKFRRLLAQSPGRLKVGIVWSGSVTFKKNSERAQPLARFVQAFAMPGVRLYSLQKGPPERELKALAGSPVVDLSPLIADFADTAAAVAELDLVIMTDSAVVHLAGALGKPVWVLLGHEAHWLWLTDRTDSPWYPSVRLFRPRATGDWDFVFDAAAHELMELAAPSPREAG